MSGDQPQLTPVLEDDDMEVEPEQDVPKLKRSHAVIDLCEEEDQDEEIAGLMGCPMCYEVIDHFRSYLEEFEASLVCTERYSDFGLPLRGGDSKPGPGLVLQPDQHLTRPVGTDRGLQSVRQLPGQPKAQAPKSKKGK